MPPTPQAAQAHPSLAHGRGAVLDVRQVARSFYAMLESEGFTNDQVLQLANDLLTLVREDLASSPPASERR
jgi:hypothetical protein